MTSKAYDVNGHIFCGIIYIILHIKQHNLALLLLFIYGTLLINFTCQCDFPN